MRTIIIMLLLTSCASEYRQGKLAGCYEMWKHNQSDVTEYEYQNAVKRYSECMK